MKIKYNGKIHETEINDKGAIISKVGNIFFGHSEGEIVKGEVYVEPEVIEVVKDNG